MFFNLYMRMTLVQEVEELLWAWMKKCLFLDLCSYITHLMVRLLVKISALSAALQQKNQNIGNVVMLITTMKNDLKKYMDDDAWENLFGVVTTFCLEKDIFVPNMEDAMLGHIRAERKVYGEPKT